MSSTQIKELGYRASKWANTGLPNVHLVKTQLPFRPKVFHLSSIIILVGIISQSLLRRRTPSLSIFQVREIYVDFLQRWKSS